VKRALLVVVTLLAGCPGPRSAPTAKRGAAAAPDRSGLVVLLVIDQFPEWSLERKRADLTHGFARLLSEGEWRVGHHPSAAALTGPGHALLGTGQPPAQSGIIANEWWSREFGKPVLAADDETGKTSDKWLRVPGLGDAIAAAHTGAKAVAVSLKNRASVLPLGHAGLAVYYDAKAGVFASYRGAPAWLAAYNREHPVAPRLAPWNPLEIEKLKALTGVEDAQPGEVGEKGFGPTFPHDPATTKNPLDAVYALPLGNDLVLETALAAIDGEKLGQRGHVDLLIVSLSAHDYIAHGWGHESWEAWDSELRLDTALEQFLAALDAKVGTQKWAMIVTSDHGGSPLPETLHGGRYTDEQLKAAANQAASLELGTGDWIAYANLPTIYLSKAALAQKPKDLEAAKKKIVFALASFPGLAATGRTETYAGHCDIRKGDERALCLSFDPERSGEFFYWPAKGWVVEEEGERLATAHGSLNDYDRNVPVIFLPFDRTPHPAVAVPGPELPLTDIAPTLAHWLGVTPPADLPH
jgi:predicted AlkP superfamily pyrophosphatase or phosphodiesterase